MANIYVGSTKYAAVTPWAASAALTAGTLRRQLATPTVGNERVFAVTTAGTTGGSEPAWNLTAGATTSDGSAVWTEVTGQAAYNGDGGGSAWAAPHARLANAEASGWSSAGDTIYVSNNHAETQSSAIAETSQGTAAAPANILCVNDSAAPPTTLATGATITPTGASSATIGGYGYYYGLRWNIGTTSGNFLPAAANNVGYYDNCTINLANSSNSSVIQFPGASASKDAFAEFRNSSFLFANAGQKITPAYGRSELIGCSFAASGTVPTSLFGFGSNQGAAQCTVRDSDLSNITGSLVNVSTGVFGDILFMNCKLNASVAVTTGAFTSPGGARVRLHNCDSGGTNYRFFEANYAGTIQNENTVVRSGGASDGTTAESWAISTSANARFTAPFSSPEIVQWNDATGSSLTATVEIAGGATLTNGDVWLTVEYPGSASSPQGSVASSRKADVLATASNVTTSSASWAGSPTAKQKLQVTFTPQQKGPVKARIHVAKASATVYIDPLLTLA